MHIDILWEGCRVCEHLFSTLEVKAMARCHELLSLCLEHSCLDRLPEVILLNDHLFIGFKISPLFHLLLSCHGLFSLPGEALIDNFEDVLLLDD